MKTKESNKPIDILERYANKKTSLGWTNDNVPDIVGFKYQFHKLFPEQDWMLILNEKFKGVFLIERNIIEGDYSDTHLYRVIKVKEEAHDNKNNYSR